MQRPRNSKMEPSSSDRLVEERRAAQVLIPNPPKQLGREMNLIYYAQRLSAVTSQSAVEDYVSPSDQDTESTDGANMLEAAVVSGDMHDCEP